MKRKKKSDGAMAMPSVQGHEPRWDLETLSRAQEIIKDTRRFDAAQREARKQSEAMSRIGRLKGVKL